LHRLGEGHVDVMTSAAARERAQPHVPPRRMLATTRGSESYSGSTLMSAGSARDVDNADRVAGGAEKTPGRSGITKPLVSMSSDPTRLMAAAAAAQLALAAAAAAEAERETSDGRPAAEGCPKRRPPAGCPAGQPRERRPNFGAGGAAAGAFDDDVGGCAAMLKWPTAGGDSLGLSMEAVEAAGCGGGRFLLLTTAAHQPDLVHQTGCVLVFGIVAEQSGVVQAASGAASEAAASRARLGVLLVVPPIQLGGRLNLLAEIDALRAAAFVQLAVEQSRPVVNADFNSPGPNIQSLQAAIVVPHLEAGRPLGHVQAESDHVTNSGLRCRLLLRRLIGLCNRFHNPSVATSAASAHFIADNRPNAVQFASSTSLPSLSSVEPLGGGSSSSSGAGTFTRSPVWVRMVMSWSPGAQPLRGGAAAAAESAAPAARRAVFCCCCCCQLLVAVIGSAKVQTEALLPVGLLTPFGPEASAAAAAAARLRADCSTALVMMVRTGGHFRLKCGRSGQAGTGAGSGRQLRLLLLLHRTGTGTIRSAAALPTRRNRMLLLLRSGLLAREYSPGVMERIAEFRPVELAAAATTAEGSCWGVTDRAGTLGAALLPPPPPLRPIAMPADSRLGGGACGGGCCWLSKLWPRGVGGNCRRIGEPRALADRRSGGGWNPPVSSSSLSRRPSVESAPFLPARIGAGQRQLIFAFGQPTPHRAGISAEHSQALLIGQQVGILSLQLNILTRVFGHLTQLFVIGQQLGVVFVQLVQPRLQVGQGRLEPGKNYITKVQNKPFNLGLKRGIARLQRGHLYISRGQLGLSFHQLILSSRQSLLSNAGSFSQLSIAGSYRLRPHPKLALNVSPPFQFRAWSRQPWRGLSELSPDRGWPTTSEPARILGARWSSRDRLVAAEVRTPEQQPATPISQGVGFALQFGSAALDLLQASAKCQLVRFGLLRLCASAFRLSDRVSSNRAELCTLRASRSSSSRLCVSFSTSLDSLSRKLLSSVSSTMRDLAASRDASKSSFSWRQRVRPAPLKQILQFSGPPMQSVILVPQLLGPIAIGLQLFGSIAQSADFVFKAGALGRALLILYLEYVDLVLQLSGHARLPKQLQILLLQFGGQLALLDQFGLGVGQAFRFLVAFGSQSAKLSFQIGHFNHQRAGRRLAGAGQLSFQEACPGQSFVQPFEQLGLFVQSTIALLGQEADSQPELTGFVINRLRWRLLRHQVETVGHNGLQLVCILCVPTAAEPHSAAVPTGQQSDIIGRGQNQPALQFLLVEAGQSIVKAAPIAQTVAQRGGLLYNRHCRRIRCMVGFSLLSHCCTAWAEFIGPSGLRPVAAATGCSGVSFSSPTPLPPQTPALLSSTAAAASACSACCLLPPTFFDDVRHQSAGIGAGGSLRASFASPAAAAGHSFQQFSAQPIPLGSQRLHNLLLLAAAFIGQPAQIAVGFLQLLGEPAELGITLVEQLRETRILRLLGAHLLTGRLQTSPGVGGQIGCPLLLQLLAQAVSRGAQLINRSLPLGHAHLQPIQIVHALLLHPGQLLAPGFHAGRFVLGGDQAGQLLVLNVQLVAPIAQAGQLRLRRGVGRTGRGLRTAVALHAVGPVVEAVRPGRLQRRINRGGIGEHDQGGVRPGGGGEQLRGERGVGCAGQVDSADVAPLAEVAHQGVNGDAAGQAGDQQGVAAVGRVHGSGGGWCAGMRANYQIKKAMSADQGRLSTTFLKPLQTQFYVPDDGRKCTPKRLIDFIVSPPASDDAEAREMRLVAEHLICHMYCTVEGQKRFFQLKVKPVLPLKACHLLLRFKYMSRDCGWKELTFHSKLSVLNKCDVSVFWVRKDLIQRDNTYRDRYQLMVDFDLVHSDWFPPENPYYVNKGTQVYKESASPKKLDSIPGTSEDCHHPESNLIIEVEGKLLYTLRDLLTAASPVFAKILQKDTFQSYSPGHEQFIQLPGKSATDVEELLRLLYPSTPHRLSLQQAPAMIILANEYQIEHIKQTAEDIIVEAFLASTDPVELPPTGKPAGPDMEKDLHRQQQRLCPMECYALARVYGCPRLERVSLCLLMDWSVERIERSQVFKRMDKEDRCALAMGRMRLMEVHGGKERQ
uniref:BTB domain-containing protein n=3 Tax=Macrostomum lignano TaxID=282301 RepID=A0A1I8HZK2_9PLAT